MKTLLKMLALVAVVVGLASCGSGPDVHIPGNSPGGSTVYIPPMGDK